MIIYKTTNLVNGKIYIGQDSNNNPNYFGSGLILKKALKKYGRCNFKKETIEECDNKEQLNEREKYFIKKFNAIEFGYNLAEGGEGGPFFKGRKHSDESKKKMKKSWKLVRESEGFVHNMTGYIFSEKQKKEFSKNRKGKLTGSDNPMFGKTHTEEAKKKMSNPRYGSDNPMFGKTHTEESKKKISEATKGENNAMFGKKHTEESKKKISEATKGRKAHNRRKLSIDGIVFDSGAKAAKHFNVSNGTVTYRCKSDKFNWNWVF